MINLECVMSASSLGNKHTCWSCGAKFYDFGKKSPTCPKCSALPGDGPKKLDLAKVAATALRAKKDSAEEYIETEEEPLADDMDIFGGFEEDDS